MRQAIDRLGMKGSVTVVNNGKTLLNYATGNKPDTSYLINSVQKSMTATMVMCEVEKGKLSLNDTLSEFYPEIEGSDYVKISNLLNMTSGLDLQKGKKLGTKVFISDEDNLKHDIKYTTFDMKSLGKWHYTAINYVLLCGIISKIENKSYENLFRETFIKPLKLQNTEFLWSDEEKLLNSNWVPGYIYSDVDQAYIRVPHATAVKDAHNELGAGSIVMSNHDLMKTIKYILTGNVLSNQSRSILFKGKKPKFYNGGFYNLSQYKVANGAGEGYYTFMRATPNAKNMIIIQSNHTTKGKFKLYKSKVNDIMSMMLSIE